MHGGHNPITPQSKTISLPTARRPAPSSIFLTEVTSMADIGGDARNEAADDTGND